MLGNRFNELPPGLKQTGRPGQDISLNLVSFETISSSVAVGVVAQPDADHRASDCAYAVVVPVVPAPQSPDVTSCLTIFLFHSVAAGVIGASICGYAVVETR